MVLVWSIALQHASAQVQFQRLINPTGSGAITYALTETLDGGFIVGGYNNVLPGADRNQFITKLDSAGNTLWTQEIAVGIVVNDAVGAVVESPDGKIIVGGYNYQAVGYLHRFSASGELELSRTIPLYPRSVISAGSDRIIVSGLIFSNSKYGVAAFDLDFNLIWIKSAGSSDGEALDILGTSDGGFLATGWVVNQINGLYSAILIVKADTAGNLLWSKYIGASPGYMSSYDGGTIETPDGGFVVCFHKATNSDPVLIKLDANGNLVWSYIYNDNLYVRDIILNEDGQPLVAAFTNVGGVGVVLFSVDHNTGNVIESVKLNHTSYAEGGSGFDMITKEDHELLFCGDAALLPASSGNGVDGFFVGNILPADNLLCHEEAVEISKNNLNLTASAGPVLSEISSSTALVNFTTNAFLSTTETWCESIPMTGEVFTTNAICFGECTGSAHVVVEGGVLPYTYAWSSGSEGINVNDLCAGNYDVMVTDANGNDITLAFTIGQPDPISVVVESTEVSICVGECVVLTAVVSGNTTDVTYAWSPMQQVEPSFEYCPEENVTIAVVATDANNCMAEAEWPMVVHPLPVVTYDQLPDSVCFDAPVVVLSGGTPTGGIYSGEYVVNGTFDPAAQFTGTFDFHYDYEDEFGCSGSAEDQLVVWACPDDVDELKTLSFSLWPNPVSNVVRVSSEMNITEIIITDQQGRELKKWLVNASTFSISLAEFSEGVYNLRVMNQHQTGTQTFTKIH